MSKYFPDSDTGYYDPEAYLEEDARLEAQQADDENRFEYEAEEMHAILWAGAIVPLVDDAAITVPPRSVVRSSNQLKEVA